MKSLYLSQLLLSAIALGVAGCGPSDFTITKKPSYADLVVTYNAEVELLDKLESKRQALIKEYFSQAQQNAIKSAMQSLDAGKAAEIPSNPNEALDRAVAAAEMQAQLQSGLLEGLGFSSSADSGDSSPDGEYPEELKVKLADLDAEIAEQGQRVGRARDARDAAEPK